MPETFKIVVPSRNRVRLMPRILELLKANGQDDVHVFIGGIVLYKKSA